MRQTQGFTLIELAVVLSIIGVLAGAVIAGQYMIRQSELLQVGTTLGKLRDATRQFKTQYEGLPGDITDATDYWGADPNGCNVNAVTTPRKETCNGNANGWINTADGTTFSEVFRAMQQLSNAGLIDGKYSGVPPSTAASNLGAASHNSMAGPWGGLYNMSSHGPFTGIAEWYDMPASTAIFFGRPTGGLQYNPVMTARQMADLDRKIDDGRPALGNIRPFKNNINTNCTTNDTAAAEYSSTEGRNCALMYLLTFTD
jgi:prepilin-type N-terminal cleavage/methylation domain-containing protein